MIVESWGTRRKIATISTLWSFLCIPQFLKEFFTFANREAAKWPTFRLLSGVFCPKVPPSLYQTTRSWKISRFKSMCCTTGSKCFLETSRNPPHVSRHSWKDLLRGFATRKQHLSYPLEGCWATYYAMHPISSTNIFMFTNVLLNTRSPLGQNSNQGCERGGHIKGEVFISFRGWNKISIYLWRLPWRIDYLFYFFFNI